MLQVLIGTLYSGENEFDRCVEMLARQSYCYRSHFIIEHMPERAGHDELYARFMHHAGEYDLFLKLDADMILSDPGSLAAAVRLFEQSPELDHAVFTVQDWMTRSAIVGLHMYRSRARWPKCTNRFVTDPPPALTGERRSFARRPPSPLAAHSPDPNPAQAFRFGLRCAIKAFQIGHERLQPVQAVAHWHLLKRLWRHFDSVRDQRLGLALMAAEHALTHPVPPRLCDYTNPRFWQMLRTYTAMTPGHIHDHLRPTWAARPRRESMWLTAFTRQLVRRPRRRLRKAG